MKTKQVFKREKDEEAGAASGPARLWDPLARLGPIRHAIWMILALNLVALQWPMLVECTTIEASRDFLPDFFQEYASCKNIFQGLPVYAEHELTSRLYLESPPRAKNLVVHVNAHPPTSVLLTFPFIWLDFESAYMAWNLFCLAALAFSIWIVIRELGIVFGAPCCLPAVALAVICYPLLEHLFQGQLGLPLSALLLGAWSCERNGRPRAAGLLIGLAATIKLFPLFLLAYFAWSRRRKVVAAGLASVALSTLVTVCILGTQAYIDYWVNVLPRIAWFRVGWNNLSILGFFSRLFDPLPDHPDNLWWKTQALAQSRELLVLGYSLTAVLLVASFAWITRRLDDRKEKDLGFGLAMIGMILLSPVAWEHYLLLMILPLTLAWIDLPKRGAPARKAVFLAVVALFWARPRGIHWLTGLEGFTAEPWHVLLIFSTQFYAMIGLYGLGIVAILRHRRSRLSHDGPVADAQSSRRLAAKPDRRSCVPIAVGSLLLVAWAADVHGPATRAGDLDGSALALAGLAPVGAGCLVHRFAPRRAQIATIAACGCLLAYDVTRIMLDYLPHPLFARMGAAPWWVLGVNVAILSALALWRPAADPMPPAGSRFGRVAGLAVIATTFGVAIDRSQVGRPPIVVTARSGEPRPGPGLGYLVYLPEDYDRSTAHLPLILYLHGAGNVGRGLERVRAGGLPRRIEEGGSLPFIVVAPYSPSHGWDVEALDALLDDVLGRYAIDADRVYLTGLSMGGKGTWALAAAHPDRFAAIAPICGEGDPAWVPRLVGLPSWAFHGAEDTVIPVDESRRMVASLERAGGKVRLTVYRDTGHDAWTRAYDEPGLYEWLLLHRRRSGESGTETATSPAHTSPSEAGRPIGAIVETTPDPRDDGGRPRGSPPDRMPGRHF